MRLVFLGKDRYTYLRGNVPDFYGNDKHAKTNTLFTNHAQIVVKVLKDALLVTLVQSITTVHRFSHAIAGQLTYTWSIFIT